MTKSSKRDTINAFFKQPEIVKLMTDQPNGYIQTIRDKLKKQTKYDISTSNVYQRVKNSDVPQRPSKHETMNTFFAQPEIIELMTVKPKSYAQTIIDTFKTQNGYDISPSNVYQRIKKFENANALEGQSPDNTPEDALDETSEPSTDDDEYDSSDDSQSESATQIANALEGQSPETVHTLTITVNFNGKRYDNISLDTLNKIHQLLQNDL